MLFLAAFYFAIASNTQSGWLFVLSAFLLGLLFVSLFGPRASLKSLKFEREVVGTAVRGRPLTVSLRLTNSGARTLREIRVVQPGQSWATDQHDFTWVIPTLDPGQTARVNWVLTPNKRGEHRLSGPRLVSGAPFGLFTVWRSEGDSPSFLIYPELRPARELSSLNRRIGFTEMATMKPLGSGQSRSLRSIREYRPGDDLRTLHWKLSARSTDSRLYVREHFPPARESFTLLFDSSQEDLGTSDTALAELLFERAVSLCASLLWQSHRYGVPSVLVLLGSESDWSTHKAWEPQFRALARVQQSLLSGPDWAEQAERYLQANRRGQAAKALCLSFHSTGQAIAPTPRWCPQRVMLLPSTVVLTEKPSKTLLLRLDEEDLA